MLVSVWVGAFVLAWLLVAGLLWCGNRLLERTGSQIAGVGFFVATTLLAIFSILLAAGLVFRCGWAPWMLAIASFVSIVLAVLTMRITPRGSRYVVPAEGLRAQFGFVGAVSSLICAIAGIYMLM